MFNINQYVKTGMNSGLPYAIHIFGSNVCEAVILMFMMIENSKKNVFISFEFNSINKRNEWHKGVIPFGKFKGQNVNEVYDDNKNYFDFIYKKWINKEFCKNIPYYQPIKNMCSFFDFFEKFIEERKSQEAIKIKEKRDEFIKDLIYPEDNTRIKKAEATVKKIYFENYKEKTINSAIITINNLDYKIKLISKFRGETTYKYFNYEIGDKFIISGTVKSYDSNYGKYWFLKKIIYTDKEVN